jgi:hypothetical protein
MYAQLNISLQRDSAQNAGSVLVEIIKGGQNWANNFRAGSQNDTAP